VGVRILIRQQSRVYPRRWIHSPNGCVHSSSRDVSRLPRRPIDSQNGLRRQDWLQTSHGVRARIQEAERDGAVTFDGLFCERSEALLRISP